MRYILDDSGYIEEVSDGREMTCNNKSCTEYTGTIPEGYTTLEEWACNANIRAYKIDTNGNLEYNELRDSLMKEEWAEYSGARNIITGYLAEDVSVANANYGSIPLTEYCKVGNKLETASITLSSNTYKGVKIGSGVTKVLVNAQMGVESGATSSTLPFNLYLYHYEASRGVSNTKTMGRLLIDAGKQEVVTLTPFLLDVEEGDLIYLRVYQGSSSITSTIMSANNRTFLTVEAL